MSPLPALLVAAALTGAVEVSDRSELRVRDSNEPAGRVVDVETAPNATLRLRARGFELTLGYAPHFTVRQIDLTPMPETLHRGALTLSWRFRRTVVTPYADVAVGTQSFTSLIPPSSTLPSETTPSIDRLPPPATILYFSWRAGLSLRHTATRRWTVGGRLEYALGGGADASSRAVLPQESNPHAALDAEYALTRKDRMITTVDAARAVFSSGLEDNLFEVTETWRHALSRRAESTLSIGAAGAAFRAGDAEALRFYAYPVAEAALTERSPVDRLEARFALRGAPVVDRLSGAVDERLLGTVSVAWTLTPSVVVRGQIGAAQSIPWSRDGALSVVLGEAAVSTRVSEPLRFEVGTRGAWQVQRGAAALPPQWVAFAAATVAIPTLRF